MPEWKPFPKQEKALASSAYEILYGGARGGGKSEAGIFGLLYDVGNPLFRGLVIRQNYTDLMDWYDRAAAVYCASPFNAKPRGKEWFEFPSGAKIRLGHLKDEKAYTKYQGHEYHKILIEELTQIPTEELYLKLLASCRSTVDGLSPQIFCTANPGEIGHAWVKRRFVDPALPSTEFRDPISGRTRIFIPSTVDDNPALLEKDPDYVRFLDSLPPDLKAWWRHGSWEQQRVKGSVFGDDLDRLAAQGRIGKIDVNLEYPVFTAWDLGLADEQICWFYQCIGEEIRFIDIYHNNNQKYEHYGQMLIDSGYRIGEVILPHDGTKRSADSLRSFRDVLEEFGFKVRITPRTNSKYGDIQKTRTRFYRCMFDAEKCAVAIDYLRGYRYKWVPEKEMFSEIPIHDVNSHYADAFMQAILSAKKKERDPEPPKPSTYIKSLDIHDPVVDDSNQEAQAFARQYQQFQRKMSYGEQQNDSY